MLLFFMSGELCSWFHLRWGCREILYDRSSDGSIYVIELSMSKATQNLTVKTDAYVAACDLPGIKRLLPETWRESEFFDNIYKLVGVSVVTVQLRNSGWVTELGDLQRARCRFLLLCKPCSHFPG